MVVVVVIVLSLWIASWEVCKSTLQTYSRQAQVRLSILDQKVFSVQSRFSYIACCCSCDHAVGPGGCGGEQNLQLRHRPAAAAAAVVAHACKTRAGTHA